VQEIQEAGLGGDALGADLKKTHQAGRPEATPELRRIKAQVYYKTVCKGSEECYSKYWGFLGLGDSTGLGGRRQLKRLRQTGPQVYYEPAVCKGS